MVYVITKMFSVCDNCNIIFSNTNYLYCPFCRINLEAKYLTDKEVIEKYNSTIE